MNAAAPRLHTKEEAAAILRVKASWLERRAAAREIPFALMSGTYLFTDDHLAQIIALHEQRPSAPRPRPEPKSAPQAGKGPQHEAAVAWPSPATAPLLPRRRAARRAATGGPGRAGA